MKARPPNKKFNGTKALIGRGKSKLVNKSPDHFPIVAIGASAGGLDAMTEFLKHLQPRTGMAFIYVQHLSPDHESILPSLLARATKMTVIEARNKTKVEPNRLYVIPPAVEMNIPNGHIKLTPRPQMPTFNYPIDILFSSLAQKHKENVIGIVLSGSASDGTRGLRAIKFEGGLTFAQDESAKFQGMPKSAIAEGVVDFILSPKEIALEINRISAHPLLKLNGSARHINADIDCSPTDLSTVLEHLLTEVGVDFKAYKMNTIKRRIERRMLLNRTKSLREYTKSLVSNKEETGQLYRDLLINVTSFFRDEETFRYLRMTLLPKLFKSKLHNEKLRIWVPGCSTGEEAYSLAMIIREIKGDRFRDKHIQVFATDLSEDAIVKARTGIYTKQEIENISPKRLKRFFSKFQGGYRISQSIRDLCVFAPHNILSDPPFSHIDFISCRNLLIYFDSMAQQNAMLTFDYALNDDGFLMLGKSETTGSSSNLFLPVNKKFKIFQRKKRSRVGTLPPVTLHNRQLAGAETMSLRQAAGNHIETKKQKVIAGGENGLDNVVNSILLSHHTPASVVINRQMEILQFRGPTSLFLEHVAGNASLNILKMARPEIQFEVRSLIAKSFKTKEIVVKKGIELNAGKTIISIEGVPLKMDPREPLLLMLFKEQTKENNLGSSGGKNNGRTAKAIRERKLKKLEEEISAYREDLRDMTHNHDAAIEELQSANEEVVSGNEELRSINEELETSKEEIQSANEELSTTNQELQARN
ncbi:MAG TPA: chemotaxis protein CheB, partial [Puia sp.]|nr:chemotaxis protein CheB [Puia sp.]